MIAEINVCNVCVAWSMRCLLILKVLSISLTKCLSSLYMLHCCAIISFILCFLYFSVFSLCPPVCPDNCSQFQRVISQELINYVAFHASFVPIIPWRCHQMETFAALLAICEGNSPVPGEFPAQRPVTRSFDAFFDLRLNKRLSEQSWGWWFETLSRPLWRHRNALHFLMTHTCVALCHLLFLTRMDEIHFRKSSCVGFLFWESTLILEIQHNTSALYNGIRWCTLVHLKRDILVVCVHTLWLLM